MEEFENLIMIEVLKAMQALGGRVTRKEVKREICDHSEAISEDKVDEVKHSKKTGTPYRPFDYRFNFAIDWFQSLNRNLDTEKVVTVKKY
jgi:restriction system protein